MSRAAQFGKRHIPEAVEELEEVEEQRAVRRTRVLKAGKLWYNDRSDVEDCTVKDFSIQGARVLLRSTYQVPADVELEIPKDDLNREAEVIWRSEKELGIAFKS